MQSLNSNAAWLKNQPDLFLLIYNSEPTSGSGGKQDYTLNKFGDIAKWNNVRFLLNESGSEQRIGSSLVGSSETPPIALFKRDGASVKMRGWDVKNASDSDINKWKTFVNRLRVESGGVVRTPIWIDPTENMRNISESGGVLTVNALYIAYDNSDGWISELEDFALGTDFFATAKYEAGTDGCNVTITATVAEKWKNTYAFAPATLRIRFGSGGVPTPPPTPTAADPKNNRIEISDSSIVEGGSVTFTGYGDRADKPGEVTGDTHYIPKSWKITGPKSYSGTFNGWYGDHQEMDTVGSYTIEMTFQCQRWSGSVWTNTTTDTKSAKFTVRAAGTAAKADKSNNALSVSDSTIEAGQTLKIMGVGDRQNVASGTVNGDERYVPVSWTATNAEPSSGKFELFYDEYRATVVPSAPGECRLTATMVLQRWDAAASRWTDTVTTDTKEQTVTVRAETEDAPLPPDIDPAVKLKRMLESAKSAGFYEKLDREGPNAVTYYGEGQLASTVSRHGLGGSLVAKIGGRIVHELFIVKSDGENDANDTSADDALVKLDVLYGEKKLLELHGITIVRGHASFTVDVDDIAVALRAALSSSALRAAGEATHQLTLHMYGTGIDLSTPFTLALSEPAADDGERKGGGGGCSTGAICALALAAALAARRR